MAQMGASFDDLPLTSRVRQSCQRVVAEAGLVTLDDDAIATIARSIEPDLERTPMPSATAAELADDEIGPATLVLALDAINFGSGYHDIVRKRSGRSGAQTMAESFTDYISWTGALGPDRLQRFTIDDCSQIFGQDLDGGALQELMSLFTTALNDLGDWLEANGGTAAVIAAAGGSSEALATHLTDMLFYRDVESHNGQPVAFYKRAQITAADLARTVRPTLFSDLDRLTAFADNLVPHTLRVLGAIALDPDLAAAIDAGVLLDPGSPPEVEIRAAGVVGVERLAGLLDAAPMDLDAHLWNLGQDPEIKSTPRHRARSVFY